jgi:WD40 repeat protein
VWNPETGRAVRTLVDDRGPVYGVAVTADGKRAVSASYDYTLKWWDLETGRELRTLEGHSGTVCGVAVTADGRRAASASSDFSLRVWDLEAGLLIVTYHCDVGVSCCVFAGDQTIVAGDAGGHLHFLRLEE